MMQIEDRNCPISMAEPKRIQLVSLAPTTKKKKTKKVPPTLRFSLTLPEPTETTCPEFSYSELLKNALNSEEKKSNNENTPAEDEHEDHGPLLALAKSFEEKYGKAGKKSKYRDKYDDFINIGEGYDTDDSFIDDGEAYDEVVPSSLNTKLGGFYINSGMLDFKPSSDRESDDDDFRPMKKKKRQLLDSDEEGIEIKKKHKTKIKDGHHKFAKKRKKFSTSSTDGMTPLKKKIIKDKDYIKKKKKNALAEILKRDKKLKHNGRDSLSMTTEDSSQGSDPVATAKIESTIDAVINAMNDKQRKGTSEIGEKQTENAPSLPSDLPPGLEAKLDQIKNVAVCSDAVNNPKRFFTSPVNKLLLEIDNQTKQLAGSQRSVIFSHLAAYLPGSKETLIKRAKKLRLSEQDDKLRKPIQALQDVINKEMPDQLEKYHAEYQKFKETLRSEQKDDASALNLSADSDEDEDKTTIIPNPEKIGQDEETTNQAAMNEKSQADKKRILGPRKKFEWTPEIRTLLCEVVKCKMEWYEVLKSKGQSAEDYLKTFLDAEIKQFWPKGWMQARMLYKESRAAHSKWTVAIMMKPKKPIIVSSKPPASSTISNTSISGSLTTVNLKDSEKKTPQHIEAVSAKPSLTLLDYANERYSQKAKGQIGKSPDQATTSTHQVISTNLTSEQLQDLLKNKMQAGQLMKKLGIINQGSSLQGAMMSPVSSNIKSPMPMPDKDFNAAFRNFAIPNSQGTHATEVGVGKTQGEQAKIYMSSGVTSQQSNVRMTPSYSTTTTDGGIKFINKSKPGIEKMKAKPSVVSVNVSGTSAQLMKSAKALANQMRVQSASPVQSQLKGQEKVAVQGQTAGVKSQGPAVKSQLMNLKSVSVRVNPVLSTGGKSTTLRLPSFTTQEASLTSGKSTSTVTYSKPGHATLQQQPLKGGHSITNILATQSEQPLRTFKMSTAAKPRPPTTVTSVVLTVASSHSQSSASPRVVVQKSPMLAELYAQTELAQALTQRKVPTSVQLPHQGMTKSPVQTPSSSQIWSALSSPEQGYSTPYSLSNNMNPPIGLPHGYQHISANSLNTSPPRLIHHPTLHQARSPGASTVSAPLGYMQHSPVSPHGSPLPVRSPMGHSPQSPIRRPSPQSAFSAGQHIGQPKTNSNPYANHYQDSNRTQRY